MNRPFYTIQILYNYYKYLARIVFIWLKMLCNLYLIVKLRQLIIKKNVYNKLISKINIADYKLRQYNKLRPITNKTKID